jgi:hypothetical protein
VCASFGGKLVEFPTQTEYMAVSDGLRDYVRGWGFPTYLPFWTGLRRDPDNRSNFRFGGGNQPAFTYWGKQGTEARGGCPSSHIARRSHSGPQRRAPRAHVHRRHRRAQQRGRRGELRRESRLYQGARFRIRA